MTVTNATKKKKMNKTNNKTNFTSLTYIKGKDEKKKYFSWSCRLIIFIVLFISSFVTCLYFGSKTFEREKQKPISYTKDKNIDYKVYLNKNDFYETDYLEKNKAYIASLIKYIDINFNYDFSIEKATNIDFTYKIIGELVIENNGGSKKYLEKQYTLLESKDKKMLETYNCNIKENIEIDYNYYNKLANTFRSTYGVDTNSYLNVYLEVSSKTDEKINYKINEKDKINLKIPLSEKAIEINFDQNNFKEIKKAFLEGKVKFNLKYLILETIFFIITSYFLIKCIKYLVTIIKPATKYDKYINKILKEYDRFIVETNTNVNLSNYNIIEVQAFTELLDVRDNLKSPILYYNIAKHQKGILYIKNDNDVYLLTIKDSDLDKKARK